VIFDATRGIVVGDEEMKLLSRVVSEDGLSTHV